MSLHEYSQCLALNGVNYTLHPTILLMGIGYRPPMLDFSLPQVMLKLVTDILSTIVTLQGNNPLAKLVLPLSLHNLPGVQGLVLSSKQLYIQQVYVVVKKQDEVMLAIEIHGQEWPANVSVNQF